jgi:hypothetical protein
MKQIQLKHSREKFRVIREKFFHEALLEELHDNETDMESRFNHILAIEGIFDSGCVLQLRTIFVILRKMAFYSNRRL